MACKVIDHFSLPFVLQEPSFYLWPLNAGVYLGFVDENPLLTKIWKYSST